MLLSIKFMYFIVLCIYIHELKAWHPDEQIVHRSKLRRDNNKLYTYVQEKINNFII